MLRVSCDKVQVFSRFEEHLVSFYMLKQTAKTYFDKFQLTRVLPERMFAQKRQFW